MRFMHVSVTVSDVGLLDMGCGFGSSFDCVFVVGRFSLAFVCVTVTMQRCGLNVFSKVVFEFDMLRDDADAYNIGALIQRFILERMCCDIILLDNIIALALLMMMMRRRIF